MSTAKPDRAAYAAHIKSAFPQVPQYCADLLLDLYFENPTKLYELMRADLKAREKQRKYGQSNVYTGPYKKIESPILDNMISKVDKPVEVKETAALIAPLPDSDVSVAEPCST